MDWNSAWQIVLTTMASFGGAGIIILSVSKWLANLAAEKILKKADFKFSQKLEALKSNFERKNYISKVRFNLEIEIYRELSETTLLMVISIRNLFAYFSKDLQQNIELIKYFKLRDYEYAFKNYRSADVAITRNAPFIQQEFYAEFDEIKKSCRVLILYFSGVDKYLDQGIYFKVKEEEQEECNKQINCIECKLNKLLEKLRKHISSLDVLDK